MNSLDSVSSLPALLQVEVERFWQDYLAAASLADQACLTQHPMILNSLPKIWACSPFVARQCIQSPALLSELIHAGALLQVPGDYTHTLAPLLLQATDEASLMSILRRYRRREMLCIAWRDLAGWASLEETLDTLSRLADALVEGALTQLYQRLIQQWGTPSDAQGTPQELVVLALGKLGGQALNFSSDIDLIFAYPSPGETTGTRRPCSNQEFFIRLGQQLIHVLNHITPEGFVFRVDMRLRPFGDSGPLVMHFAAMEDYYQTHARDWERYAFVKARVIAGDKQAGTGLLKALQPFVYRRYLDFNALEALRTMKALIDQETSRKGLNDNIKLGPGGIREIEFVCQMFQLIRGGRQPALQQRHLLTTLTQLEKYHLLPPETVEKLRAAYRFLRLSENHLQEMEDQQTQTLPKDPLNQLRLAYSLGLTDWNPFIAQLLHHQQTVHQEFEQVIAPPQGDTLHAKAYDGWQTLWLHGLGDDERAKTALTVAGFQEATVALERLRQLVNARSVRSLTQRGRERLDKLMPLLLTTTSQYQQPDNALYRTLNLMEAIVQRDVYLTLLLERPQVLKQVVHLCADSAWIAEQITRYPLLLDELIDTRQLYDPLEPAELEQALQTQLAHLPADDLEVQMDTLCQFKRAHVLRVAAAEISGHLSVEVVSDYLTAIADALVKQALAIAYHHLAQKHGQPYYREHETQYLAGFCILGYGKAGGIELSYSSDLDVVFLHNSQGDAQITDGNKPLDNQVFFIRLAQRIIHILTTNTPAGVLYEVDARLRPSGHSGLLVSSLEAFETYQRETAWTWEHQALIRARVIAGDVACQERFEVIRRNVLCQHRDPEVLRQAVREMRQKMRDSLDKSTETRFDIKQGQGGITDIEFIVQYGVLRWAADYPDLVATTGMLPLLQLFAQYSLFTETTCEQLSMAYRNYRSEIHRLALQNKPAETDSYTFTQCRQFVQQWWEQIIVFGEG